jgi:uncharacterized protein YndB with AHSA1/START domain
MTPRSTEHATFTIERTYDAAPERVFAAWADPAAKARWFGGPGDGDTEYELDFRVGGRELNRGGPPGGPVYTYEAVWREEGTGHLLDALGADLRGEPAVGW